MKIDPDYDGQPYKIVSNGKIVGYTRLPFDATYLKHWARSYGHEGAGFATVKRRKTGDAESA